MIIGVDLDNTIINHNQSFKILYESLYKRKKIPKISNLDFKNHLKYNLTKYEWIRVQEKVYSEFFNKYAKTQRGFKKFLIRTKILNHKLLIVSHKTKFSLHNKNNLRVPAYNFLKKKLNINKNQIYFFSNFEQKIKFINNYNFQYFIDDLPKVINSINLKKEKKILYGNINSRSEISNNIFFENWLKIEKYIYQNSQIHEIKKYLKFYYFNNFQVKKKYYSNNSLVMKIVLSECDKQYKLKISNQSKQRIKNEFNLVRILSKSNINFQPIPYKYDANYEFALYEWIDGKSPISFNKHFTNKLMSFLYLLNISNSKNKVFIKNASSACFSFNDIFIQFKKRLNAFYDLKNNKLDVYLDQLNNFFEFLSKNLQKIRHKKFPKKELILSPSDLSLKNFIKAKNEIYFIDYEYFGIDNAVKLLSDIILHPNNNLSKKQITYLFKNYNNFFIQINKKRFKQCFYLYGLIWCMIILNPLKSGQFNFKTINKSKRLFYSLKKKYSEKYLNEIISV